MAGIELYINGKLSGLETTPDWNCISIARKMQRDNGITTESEKNYVAYKLDSDHKNRRILKPFKGQMFESEVVENENV